MKCTYQSLPITVEAVKYFRKIGSLTTNVPDWLITAIAQDRVEQGLVGDFFITPDNKRLTLREGEYLVKQDSHYFTIPAQVFETSFHEKV